MLENAGAVVVSPRERDWQKNEIIVDNDNDKTFYAETNDKRKWENFSGTGFASHEGTYGDGENPFQAGTARQIESIKRQSRISYASYQPYFPEDGFYAVYVSYKTVKRSVERAEYIVYHKGQETHFHVNQKMGGGTWVYLGTFEFDRGCNIYNRVLVTNHSKKRGIVTADAVRFGGGMGNIARGDPQVAFLAHWREQGILLNGREPLETSLVRAMVRTTTMMTSTLDHYILIGSQVVPLMFQNKTD